jgi:hypothetical protein
MHTEFLLENIKETNHLKDCTLIRKIQMYTEETGWDNVD